MNIIDLFTKMNLVKQDLYNARAAVRSYLKWVDPKLARKANDSSTLESFNILEIPLSSEQINAFATEGRTNRNHAVFLRRIFEAQNEINGTCRKVPAYIVHAGKIKQLEFIMDEKGLTKKTFAVKAGLKQNEFTKIFTDWSNLSPEIAAKIDLLLRDLDINLQFSDNVAHVLLSPPQERFRVITNRKKEPLPQALETFIANVRKFYLSPRTSYDGCDTGRSPRPATIEKLCHDLRSFFQFLCQDIQWFYSRYREEFGSDFKAIEMPIIQPKDLTFKVLFRPELVKLYARYYLPLKAALESGDIELFKTGKNTETSPKWVQSVRPLFNRTGYVFLAERSQRIQLELGLSVQDLQDWKADCLTNWSAYGEVDKVCRDNAVASRPRTPKKSTDDQEKAILNTVLDMPMPIQVINIFHSELKKFMYNLDPSTELYREVEQVLFISYFLTALPLRVSNLTALTVAGRRNGLDQKTNRAVISWDGIKKCAKLFIHADLVKNGKRLGAIDRRVPAELLSLLQHRFGRLDGLTPRKMITLSPAKINEYLNKLSFTFLRDYFPKGMTVHCYRHIVASTVIKEDPAGHIVAAQLLHDDFNQIVKTYGFMRQDEHVARYYDKGGFKGVFSDAGRNLPSDRFEYATTEI